MLVLYQNAFTAPQGLVDRAIADRQHLNRVELEDWLRRQVQYYQTRKARYWRPDFSSAEAYLASIAGNRERWRAALGVIEPPDADFSPQLYPAFEDDEVVGQWVEVQLDAGVWARAIFARPKRSAQPLPLVVAHHGISCSPEHVFGFVPGVTEYAGFGQRLARDGYAVLAPLATTTSRARARLERLCRVLGFTLHGVEVARVSRLLDWASNRDDVDPERMGMWGLIMGGLYTLFTGPVEPRLKLGIVSAFFNHRPNKLAIEDPRYSCYLPLDEEAIFVPGWLREFSDAELLALCCPRPVQVQCGKCDGVSWWPMVVEEFGRGQAYYEALGVGERCEMCLHHGGHEVVYDAGVEFLRRWL